MKEVEKAESAKKKKEEKKRKEKEEGRGQEKERSQESQVSKSLTSELKPELFRTRFPHQEQLSQREKGWFGNSQEGLGGFLSHAPGARRDEQAEFQNTGAAGTPSSGSIKIRNNGRHKRTR